MEFLDLGGYPSSIELIPTLLIVRVQAQQSDCVASNWGTKSFDRQETDLQTWLTHKAGARRKTAGGRDGAADEVVNQPVFPEFQRKYRSHPAGRFIKSRRSQHSLVAFYLVSNVLKSSEHHPQSAQPGPGERKSSIEGRGMGPQSSGTVV